MTDLTAEQIAQRIFDCRLLETDVINNALSEAGGRGRATADEFIGVLLRRELMTNWQLARVLEGHMRGYFYGRYKVLYIVGAGTFARVYRAVHRDTGDVAAVKVLRSRYSNDSDTRERFGREGRMVMKLKHPNIVPIHEVAEENGRSYMVMDFVEGQNLRDYVKAHKKLDVPISLNILRDLAAGLAYAAERGITHRDMKLSNVLLSSSQVSRLVDFGLATVSRDFADDPDDLFNPRSIDYAGLEKNTNAPKNDPRSDIYFLGCMFYHMVTGEPPLFETRERIKRLSAGRYREVKPMTSYDRTFPHRAVILCNRLMDLDFTNRIQSPKQALAETEAVIKAIKAGDTQRFDEEKAEELNKAYEARIRKEEEGTGKTVMVVESSAKVQDSLREKLKNVGYRVLIVGDPDRALERFDDLDPAEDLPADCVIFGSAGNGKRGIEAFLRFSSMESTSRIPSILMLTAKMAKYRSKIEFSENRTSLDMPVKFKNMRQTLRKLLDLPDPNSSANGDGEQA
ncbi:MAG: serine/threonine-protein kinase [Planctomycetota bacterium]